MSWDDFLGPRLRILALALGLGGCVVSPFPRNVHVSTKQAAVGDVEKIAAVSTEQCVSMVLFVPIFEPMNLNVVYERLFDKADILKADALVDYHVRGGDLAGFAPFFGRGCVEHAAMAVRLR